jgi:hypothetical protein
MTSKNMMTSLASMTSTASLASKSQKLLSGWFPCHQEPQQPQRPQWPQWPRWPQWPQQPHFIKKLTEHDVVINLATKWPILVSQCGMDHQKTLYFKDFWDSFCWRLWRPWMLLSTKSKGHKSKFRISWMYRYHFYELKVHFWWLNKRFFWCRSSLNTLYIGQR